MSTAPLRCSRKPWYRTLTYGWIQKQKQDGSQPSLWGKEDANWYNRAKYGKLLPPMKRHERSTSTEHCCWGLESALLER
jgi:hypothetical protein